MVVLVATKIFLGVLFVLLAPGLAWSYIFFARRDIDWIERGTLSLGLSIVLVAISVFWLNWLFNMKVTLLSSAIVAFVLAIIAVSCIFVRRSNRGKNVSNRLKAIFSWHGRK